MRVLSTVVVAACIACSNPTGSNHKPVTVSNRVPSSTSNTDDLQARADEAFAAELRLDYRLPIERPWVSKAYPLQLEACRSGVERACWIAMMLAPDDQFRVAAKLVRTNCQLGRALSCRALPVDVAHAEDLAKPFEVCFENCAATVERWVDGCRQGIVAECAALRTHGVRDKHRGYFEYELFASLEMCNLTPRGCEYLAHVQGLVGDKLGTRDVLERVCQRSGKCDLLLDFYRGAMFPEPYPGRKDALLAWTCKHEIVYARSTLCGGVMTPPLP